VSLFSLLDRVLDATVLPGYSKAGYELRRLAWPERGRIDTDMTGKTVAVSGATGGLGRAAAIGFARLGARVLLIARDRGRGEEAARDIIVAARNPEVRVVVCDLADLDSVRAAAAQIDEPLHALVNNAGVLPERRELSVDGFELTFATNVLGTFLLTELLTDVLAESAPSRIITVSSGGMYTRRLDLQDLQATKGDFDGARAYALTKRAEVALTRIWAERLADRGITAHAMHPGWVDTPGLSASLPRFHAVTKPILRSAEQGADTIVWLGAADHPGATTGLFWHDRRPRPTDRLPGTREHDGDAERLYATCRRLTGLDAS